MWGDYPNQVVNKFEQGVLPDIRIWRRGVWSSGMTRIQKNPDMLEEYDFSKGVQGKYAKSYAEGTNVVIIEPDVAKVFPDSQSVNEALRTLARVLRNSEYDGQQSR